ncbi:MAG: hypothetical protein QT10_C0008G0051 [archaeon GW2011_AR19]|nr:MAG: hypothetical protein QT10_C0008G0051 [archaeon GW2011_AR19]
MTNHIEHFTAPGKYYIDKFFEKINRIVNTPREKTENKIENHKNPEYKIKQNYNRMQNK